MSTEPDSSGDVRRRRAKNRALLSAILAFAALIWIVSMIRMGGG